MATKAFIYGHDPLPEAPAYQPTASFLCNAEMEPIRFPNSKRWSPQAHGKTGYTHDQNAKRITLRTHRTGR